MHLGGSSPKPPETGGEEEDRLPLAPRCVGPELEKGDHLGQQVAEDGTHVTYGIDNGVLHREGTSSRVTGHLGTLLFQLSREEPEYVQMA